nr:hypothetical protein [Tanacetum cinerariifolium]
MHFLLTVLKVVYVLTIPMPELMEDATVEAIRISPKWENDDYICQGHILNGMSDSLFNVYTNVESAKELWDSLETKYMAEDSSKGGKNKNNKQNKGKKRGFKDNNAGFGSNKKPKLECWKCGKTGHFKRDCRSGNKKNNASASGSGKGSKGQSQDQGSVVLEFSSRKPITLFNVLYAPKLRKNLISGLVLNKGGYKQVYESDKYILSESGVFMGFGYYNNGMFMLNFNKVLDDSGSVYMSSSTIVNSSLWHARLGHVHYKRMLEMSKDDLIPAINENTKKCRIIHETTAPYTPQQNGVAKRKNRAPKEMVNSMLSYSGLGDGFWGEAMLTDCYLLNRVPNKRNKTTPYELWYNK